MTAPSAVPALRGWVTVTGVLALTGAAAGWAVATRPTAAGLLLLVLGTVLVATGAIVLSFKRFELFVLGFLVVRPSLDTVQLGGLDAGMASGVLFLSLSLWWLVREYRAGQLQPLLPSTGAVLLVAAVGALSAVASVSPVVSLQAGIKLLAGAVMFAVLGQLLATQPTWAPWVVRSVVVSAVVPLAFAVSQLGTAPTVDASGTVSRVSGTFVHPNPFATYLVIVVLVAAGCLGAARWVERALLVAIGAVAVVALIGTGSRGAWLALVVGAAYLLASRHPRVVLPVAAVFVLIALASPTVGSRFSDLNDAPPVHGAPANSLEWRWQYWHTLPALSADRPVTGLGLETVPLLTAEGLQPHNVWLQAYTELGALGVVSVLTLVVTVALELRTRRRRAADSAERLHAQIGTAVAIGLLLQSLTENLLTQTFAYWYFTAACAYGLRSRVPEPDPELDPAGEGLHLVATGSG